MLNGTQCSPKVVLVAAYGTAKSNPAMLHTASIVAIL